MAKIGMFGLGWQVYWTNLAAHAGVTFVAYLLFGGVRLFAFRPQPGKRGCPAVSDLVHSIETTGSLSP